MTKYVLHGGDTGEKNSDNDSFFHAITANLSDRITILLVYFARKEEDISPYANEDKERFMTNSENKNLEFVIANAKDFVDQVKKAHVVYIRGGRTELLKKRLPTNIDWKKLFDNKVVVGSSAGCYVLSQYHWNKTEEKFDKGLGVVPITAICHYTPADDEIIKRVTSDLTETPLLTLPNYKWAIFFI